MAILLKVTMDGKVLANTYDIVDLKSPFQWTVAKSVCKKGKSVLRRKPSETLGSSRLLTYSCPINDEHFGRLYRIYPDPGFKCHAVYKTIRGRSKLLRARALDMLLQGRLKRTPYERSSKFINQVLGYIIKSYDYDAIVCDFPINGDIGIPVIRSDDWYVQSVEDHSTIDLKFLASICLHQRIPLNSLNYIIKLIDPGKSTNINAKLIKDYNNVLVLSGTNGFYSSYLTQYFYSIYPDKEILPLVLFIF